MRITTRKQNIAAAFAAIAPIAAALIAALAGAAAHAAPVYVKSWGNFGVGTAQFNVPLGIAVGPAGQVYVTDAGNNRVERFDANGGYQLSFGSAGNGAGHFNYPAGIMVNASGQVYVSAVPSISYAPGDGSGTQRFSSDGVYQLTFPAFTSPFTVPTPGATTAREYGMATNAAGQILGADYPLSQVSRFDGSGNYLGFYSSPGTANGQVRNPWGIAINSAGQIFISDTLDSRIERFDASGNFQLAFGTSGSSLGQLNTPTGIAFGPSGNLYVVDNNNQRVERFDANGNYQTFFGSGGTGAGQFSFPNGIAVSPTGEIFVTDGSNYRVQKWFDLSEWVSGAPYFDSAAVGPGQLLGTSLAMSSSQGLQVAGALSVRAGGTLTQSGTISSGSVNNSGQYTINAASLTLTSGSLTNNAACSIAAGGSVVGNVMNAVGATLLGNGCIITGNLANSGSFSAAGQVSVGGSLVNNGNLTPTGQLVVSGTLTNNSLISLSPGAAIATDASGPLLNSPAGIIRGDGAVTLTMSNQGLIYANGTSGLTLSNIAVNQGGGELRVADGDSLAVYGPIVAGSAVSNSAAINLMGPGAVLSGDSIANYGTIQGQGRISNNSITNLGTIRASGGALVLAGAPINTANSSIIQSAAGTSIVIPQGMSLNSGLIALTGGSFDNGGHTMINYYSASILGNGSFSTGGLANYSTVTFSDGNSSIFGGVTNNGGTISTYGSSATIVSFYGSVVNSASTSGAGGHPAGYIKVNGNAVRWLGGFTNNGIYVSDPAANYFSGLAVGPSGVLQGGVGDQFFVTGSFTNAGDIDLGGTSQMVVDNGTGLLTQTAGLLELGGAPSGSATLSAGTVVINGGTLVADGPGAVMTASLVYGSSATSTYQGVLAGGGNSLTVNNPTAHLVLSGAGNSYTGGTFVTAGELLVTNVDSIRSGTAVSVGDELSAFGAPPIPTGLAAPALPVPEPGTLLLLAAAAVMATARKSRAIFSTHCMRDRLPLKLLVLIAPLILACVSTTAIAAPTFVKTWGTSGGSSGQFNQPGGIAVGLSGQVYVGDSNNNRVQEFDSNGGFLLSFGSSGSGIGQFNYPYGIVVNSAGQVYVGDAGNFRIQRFDANGIYQTSFGTYGSSNGQFNGAFAGAVNSSGQIYIADSGNNRIQRFDSNNVYQTNFGAYGPGNGQFFSPYGIAVNQSTGQVYVADTANYRIQRFDSNGVFQLAFGSFGSGAGQFNYAYDVAVSATGLVYGVDYNNSRVERFDGNGIYQTSFGIAGSGSGQFNSPKQVAVSPTGEIFVTDFNNSRISKWFDPAEWVSGSPHFDAAAIGTGQLLGASVTLDATHGLLVNGLLNILASGSLNQAGTASLGSMTNSGYFTLSTATLTLTAGSLTNNASAAIYSGIVIGSAVNNFGASLYASGADFTGSLLNNGTLTQVGQLVVSGSLTNNGLVALNPSGAISTDAGGTFTNAANGTLRGDGAVTMMLTNQGLIHASRNNGLTLSSFVANSAGGELRAADGDTLTVLAAAGQSSTFANQGLISLKGPNAALGGDTIANTGTIQGQGRIADSIANSGIIGPSGGQLILAGLSISNSAAGAIRIPAGASLLVSNGMGVNVGQIALTGGAFDNNAHVLANSGSILGNGSFSTGGLTNYGTVTFSDSNSSIFGAVTNAAGGTLTTYGTAATNVSFYGAVINSASTSGAGGHPAGYIKINGNTVRWLGGLTNNGTYLSDPADNYFAGLANGASGLLQGGIGDRFFVTSPFTNAGQIKLGGTSQVVVDNGTGLVTQTAGLLELGTSAMLSAGTVAINGGVLVADGPGAVMTASLVYGSSSTSTYQGVVAGGGNSLTVNNPAAHLILSGAGNSYSGGTFVTAGELLVTNAGSIPSGTAVSVGDGLSAFGAPPVLANSVPPGTIAQAVPEPGTVALLFALAAGALAMAGKSRRLRK